jgi:hypothetical protein
MVDSTQSDNRADTQTNRCAFAALWWFGRSQPTLSATGALWDVLRAIVLIALNIGMAGVACQTRPSHRAHEIGRSAVIEIFGQPLSLLRLFVKIVMPAVSLLQILPIHRLRRH